MVQDRIPFTTDGSSTTSMTTFVVVVVVVLVDNIKVYAFTRPSTAGRHLTHNFHSSLPDAKIKYKLQSLVASRAAARVCTVSTNDSRPGVNYYFGDVGRLF